MTPAAQQMFILVFAGLNAFSGLATFVVALIVWQLQKRSIAAEHSRAARLMLNELHMTAISRDEILDAANQLHGPNSLSEDKSLRRKRYYALCKLNLMEELWYGKRQGLIPITYADKFLNEVLPPMLLDEDAFKLTQVRGFHPEFRKLCSEKQVLAKNLQQNK